MLMECPRNLIVGHKEYPAAPAWEIGGGVM